jgi:hypothetical protein
MAHFMAKSFIMSLYTKEGKETVSFNFHVEPNILMGTVQ